MMNNIKMEGGIPQVSGLNINLSNIFKNLTLLAVFIDQRDNTVLEYQSD